MIRKINFVIIFCLIFSFVISLILNEQNNDFINQTAPLQVFYIDVEQGDSALIKCNNEFMLIDSGEKFESEKVINFLKEQQVETIKYVIATHPHSDHIGGMSEIINEFNVENIIMPKVTNNTQFFEDMILSIKQKNVNVITALANKEYSLGESKFFILSPNVEKYENLNNYSVVTKLVYGNASFLFTGDIESMVEKQLLEESVDLDATVLKVAHHGSDTSSTINFLKSVNPTVSVISVGSGNTYGHPNDDILKRITSYSKYVYRTDQNGDIGIFTDGKTLEVITEKR